MRLIYILLAMDMVLYPHSGDTVFAREASHRVCEGGVAGTVTRDDLSPDPAAGLLRLPAKQKPPPPPPTCMHTCLTSWVDPRGVTG